MSNARAGMLIFRVGGRQYSAKGNFTYNLGHPKREPIMGSDGTHGYKLVPQTARIEGEITDSKDLSLAALLSIDGETATLELANGKTVVLPEAWFAGEGDAQTEEGNIKVLLNSKKQGREI